MHSIGVAHRDLKLENILCVDDQPNSQIKVSDFGLSKIVEKKKKLSSFCGTPGYVAPEVLARNGYGFEGCVIMYVLLCGYPPFYEENDALLFDQIQNGSFEFDSSVWDTISSNAKDLISHLLIVDPQKRLTAEQALKHPW
ncbi:MAG: putative CAMK/CAMK1 protein kinase, partial [Streblomastix strix]